MAAYIHLMKLTEQGVRDIKNAPQRIDAAAKAIEAAGGRMTHFYCTMGEYDYVCITEGISDEVGMSLLLKIGSQGNVRTSTLKAFNRQEFGEIVKKIQ